MVNIQDSLVLSAMVKPHAGVTAAGRGQLREPSHVRAALFPYSQLPMFLKRIRIVCVEEDISVQNPFGF